MRAIMLLFNVNMNDQTGVPTKSPASEVLHDAGEDQGWADFRDQCRRQMKRPMELRLRYGFFCMYKPVLDDAPWRAFDTMAEYRAWCESSLPAYLGFGRSAK